MEIYGLLKVNPSFFLPFLKKAVQQSLDEGLTQGWHCCPYQPLSDCLRADFVVRGVWEPDRDCIFSIRTIHAGLPRRATQHISYQNALN